MTPEQFSAELERVWKDVAPLYQELHTYVRRKLIQKYGAAAERKDGDRKSTRLNSSHLKLSRMPSSA